MRLWVSGFLLLLIGVPAAWGQQNPYFDYSTLRPAPQWVSHFNDGRILEVTRDTGYELLVTPGWSEDADFFVQRLKDLLLVTTDVKVTPVADLTQHGAYVAILRVAESWEGPRHFPQPREEAQGYALQIAPEGFALVGRDRVGAFHGLQTILQALAIALDTQAKLPAVLITDWPEIAHRSMLLVVNRLRGGEDLSYLKQVLSTLAALKYNSVFFEFDHALPGPGYAFPEQVRRPLDDRAVAELCDHARRLHMEVNLAFQFGSHCTWLLAEPAYRDLGEPTDVPMGWNNSNWSPRNEKLWAVVKDLVLHQIAVCKPARVHIAHDEMDYGEFNTSASSRAANLSNDQLISEGINRLRAIIPGDIKLQIWHDLFMPESLKKSHAVGFVNSDRMFELTPDAMTFHIWEYTGSTHHIAYAAYLKKHGRTFWTSTFDSQGIERVCYYTRMLGAEGVMGTHWYEIDSKWTSPQGISSKAMHAIVTLGHFAWNLSPLSDLFEQDASRRFRLLAEGITPFPGHAHTEPVSLAAHANLGAGQESQHPYLETLTQAFHRSRADRSGAGAGILLAGKPGDRAALPEKVVLPVDRSVSAVRFYHTAGIPDPEAGLSAWNRAVARPQIGSYTLVFEAGQGEEREVIPLAYRWNIQDWNSLFGAYEGPLAWSQVTEDGLRMQVQSAQWQARDGRERRLKAIEFKSDLTSGIHPVLLEVVTFGNEAESSSQQGAIEEVIWGDDFEYRSLEALQATWRGRTRTFDTPQWHPVSASAGRRSLKWPLHARGQMVRQDIGFQVDRLDLTDADELRLTLRTTEGLDGEVQAIRCFIYFGNAEADYWYRLRLSLPVRGQGWQSYRIPLAGASSEGKLPPAGGMSNLDTVMISAWHNIHKPIVLLLDDIQLVKSSDPSLYQTVR